MRKPKAGTLWQKIGFVPLGEVYRNVPGQLAVKGEKAEWIVSGDFVVALGEEEQMMGAWYSFIHLRARAKIWFRRDYLNGFKKVVR